MEDLTWWQQALIAIAGAAGTFITGAISLGLKRGLEWLSHKTKMSFLQKLDGMAIAFVVDLYNTEVEAAKAAAKDGKLSAEEKAMFKRIVLDKLREHFGMGLLKKYLGGNVEAALGATVEKAVTVSKVAGAPLPLVQ